MQIWALPPFTEPVHHQLASPRLLEASTRRYAPSCAFVTPQELCCTKRPVRFCGDSQGSILVNCHNRFNCRGNILPSSLHAPTVCIDSTNINIASSREPWAIAYSTKKEFRLRAAFLALLSLACEPIAPICYHIYIYGRGSCCAVFVCCFYITYC